MVSPRKSRSSMDTEYDYFLSTTPGSASSPTPERQSPPPPNLIASPPSSSDEASFRNHGWASPVASGPRRRCSLSSCAEGTASPQRWCGSLTSCAKAISCDTTCVEVGGAGAGCCSSPNQNRRQRRKRGRRSAGRRGSGASGACIGGDCSEGGGTCITIHLPPTSVLQSRIGKAASFLLFVYLLCLMRWVVDSQKHSLRMAREVEESLRMETDIAREATQTLKDLELEFQEELRLAAASASAAVTAARSAMDGMGNGDLRADTSTYGSDMSTATTSIDARPGEDSVHGRLRR